MDISEIDWDICVLCQKDSTETLICADKQHGTGYSYAADYPTGFERTAHCPICVDLSLVDEGDGHEAVCRSHSDKWF